MLFIHLVDDEIRTAILAFPRNPKAHIENRGTILQVISIGKKLLRAKSVPSPLRLQFVSYL
jgi:hypothetical protein